MPTPQHRRISVGASHTYQTEHASALSSEPLCITAACDRVCSVYCAAHSTACPRMGKVCPMRSLVNTCSRERWQPSVHPEIGRIDARNGLVHRCHCCMNTLVPDASNTRLDGVHQQAPRPLRRERTAVGSQSSTADAARQCRAVTHLYTYVW